ncbi:hypothetical protein ACHAPA_003639 [Fusarium lateritium]
MDSITDAIPITGTYWPVFKREVEADEARVRPIQLECLICCELMTTSPDEPDHTYVGTPSHGAQILPCGHMIGASCWFEWLDRMKRIAPRKKFDKCPCCNMKFRFHTKCGHRTAGRFIPDTVAEYSAVPALLSHGGRISSRCWWCELKLAMKVLCSSAQIPSPKVQPGEYTFMIFHVEGNPLLYQYPSYRLPSQLDTIVRELEIPQELVTIWDVVHLTWKLNSVEFWYERDIAQTEFSICVFRSYSFIPKPGTELISV